MNSPLRITPLTATALIATLAGVIWYLEPVLGGLRMDHLGIPRTGAVLPSLAFVVLKVGLALVCALLLARILARLGATTTSAGASVGLVLGLIAATLSFDSAQAGQPLVLILTDGLFMVAVATGMGAALANSLGRREELSE